MRLRVLRTYPLRNRVLEALRVDMIDKGNFFVKTTLLKVRRLAVLFVQDLMYATDACALPLVLKVLPKAIALLAIDGWIVWYDGTR